MGLGTVLRVCVCMHAVRSTIMDAGQAPHLACLKILRTILRIRALISMHGRLST